MSPPDPAMNDGVKSTEHRKKVPRAYYSSYEITAMGGMKSPPRICVRACPCCERKAQVSWLSLGAARKIVYRPFCQR